MMITAPAHRRLILLALALTLASTAGCKVNPVTGRSQFNALSREQEIALGTEAMPELIEGYGGALPDPQITGYVENIGRTLADKTELDYPSLPWEFTTLNSDIINAFALPGGKVFISRGLLAKMDNEAQLAGVLGHEVGHVTARHANDMVTRQILLTGIAIGGAVVAGTSSDRAVQVGAGVVVGASGIFALSFSRDQEIEADKLGLRYMTHAGYDPRGLKQVMTILEEAAGGASQPEFLSTHPHPQTRINRINRALKNEYADTLNNPDYQLHEQRFRTQLLNRLAQLDPAPHPFNSDALLAEGALASLGEPWTWCGICAARRAQSPAR